MEKLDQINEEAGQDLFTSRNNSFDKQFFELDEFSSGIQKELLERIQKDLYIQECFEIMRDLINP